jgi:hypothetical protein
MSTTAEPNPIEPLGTPGEPAPTGPDPVHPLGTPDPDELPELDDEPNPDDEPAPETN